MHISRAKGAYFSRKSALDASEWHNSLVPLAAAASRAMTGRLWTARAVTAQSVLFCIHMLCHTKMYLIFLYSLPAQWPQFCEYIMYLVVSCFFFFIESCERVLIALANPGNVEQCTERDQSSELCCRACSATLNARDVKHTSNWHCRRDKLAD